MNKIEDKCIVTEDSKEKGDKNIFLKRDRITTLSFKVETLNENDN